VRREKMVGFATIVNNSSVFTSQNAYVSIELFYGILALFSIFLIASLFLSGKTHPFEKIFSAIVAFVFSVVITLSSYSLAIMKTDVIGFINGVGPSGEFIQQNFFTPTIIMQNGQIFEIALWIVTILSFINIINSVLVLIDATKKPNNRGEY
jgi:hypothetical protein